MNQEKIGKFIFELRKEKNITQQELANKIGVTDKAISKWENGRGMPDLSLIKVLCTELGITINELLSGERIDKKEYQKKLEENILNTIDYSNQKIRKRSKIFKIVLGTMIILIVTITSMFFVDVSQMNQKKPVIFSTWGYKYAPAITISEAEIHQSVIDYVVQKNDQEPSKYENEKSFASMKVYLLQEEKRNKLYFVYAWVRIGKYYLENNELKESSGSSIPYKFQVEYQNGKYVVIHSQNPRDGSYYPEDMKNIFPSSVRNDMENVHIDGTVKKLGTDIEYQAKLYFHK